MKHASSVDDCWNKCLSGDDCVAVTFTSAFTWNCHLHFDCNFKEKFAKYTFTKSLAELKSYSCLDGFNRGKYEF